MFVTADTLRRINRPFTITIGKGPDGQPVELLVRRPDIRRLIYNNMLPVPLLAKVSGLVSTWVGQKLDDIPDDKRADGPDALLVLEHLLVDMMVQPKGALDDNGGTDCINVRTDLDVATKEKIFYDAMRADPFASERKAEQQSAETFPAGRPGEGAAPDVPRVRATA